MTSTVPLFSTNNANKSTKKSRCIGAFGGEELFKNFGIPAAVILFDDLSVFINQDHCRPLLNTIGRGCCSSAAGPPKATGARSRTRPTSASQTTPQSPGVFGCVVECSVSWIFIFRNPCSLWVQRRTCCAPVARLGCGDVEKEILNSEGSTLLPEVPTEKPARPSKPQTRPNTVSAG